MDEWNTFHGTSDWFWRRRIVHLCLPAPSQNLQWCVRNRIEAVESFCEGKGDNLLSIVKIIKEIEC